MENATRSAVIPSAPPGGSTSKTGGIPTRGPRGLLFRSRTEARWAHTFDLIKWEWEYEPIDLHGYVPDFIIRFSTLSAGDADSHRSSRGEGNESDTLLLVEVKGTMDLNSEVNEFMEKLRRSGWTSHYLLVCATTRRLGSTEWTHIGVGGARPDIPPKDIYIRRIERWSDPGRSGSVGLLPKYETMWVVGTETYHLPPTPGSATHSWTPATSYDLFLHYRVEAQNMSQWFPNGNNTLLECAGGSDGRRCTRLAQYRRPPPEGTPSSGGVSDSPRAEGWYCKVHYRAPGRRAEGPAEEGEPVPAERRPPPDSDESDTAPEPEAVPVADLELIDRLPERFIELGLRIFRDHVLGSEFRVPDFDRSESGGSTSSRIFPVMSRTKVGRCLVCSAPPEPGVESGCITHDTAPAVLMVSKSGRLYLRCLDPRAETQGGAAVELLVIGTEMYAELSIYKSYLDSVVLGGDRSLGSVMDSLRSKLRIDPKFTTSSPDAKCYIHDADSTVTPRAAPRAAPLVEERWRETEHSELREAFAERLEMLVSDYRWITDFTLARLDEARTEISEIRERLSEAKRLREKSKFMTILEELKTRKIELEILKLSVDIDARNAEYAESVYERIYDYSYVALLYDGFSYRLNVTPADSGVSGPGKSDTL